MLQRRDLSRILTSAQIDHSVDALVGWPCFLEPRDIDCMFHSLCARAEAPQLRVHDLRHSCATLLFTMGVPPGTVQRILRHSSITVTTGTDVEVIEAVQRDASDSMGALFNIFATSRRTGCRQTR